MSHDIAEKTTHALQSTVAMVNTERELLRTALLAALDARDIDDRRELLDALGFNKPEARERLNKARAARKAAKR